MAFDKDLEFLETMESEDLEVLVSTLTHDKDKKKRRTESLTSSEVYKRHYPNHQKYVREIIDELQRFGGHSFINILRKIWADRNGVFYAEILRDVCDKCKVNYNKDSGVERIEELLLQKILEDSLEKLMKEKSDKEIKEFLKELGVNENKFYDFSNLARGEFITIIMQSVIQAGGFASYKIALIVANTVAKQMLGRGLSLAANAALTRTISVFAGPIGWALSALWVVSDIAGPAYRVTIPAVIQVAYLRQKHKLTEEDKRKLQEEEERRQKEIEEELKKRSSNNN